MKAQLDLLDQIIEMAKAKDEAWKEIHQRLHKSAQTVGQDSIVFHLEKLRELILSSQTTTSFSFPNMKDGEIVIGTGMFAGDSSYDFNLCPQDGVFRPQNPTYPPFFTT